jgi:hypothetical protein
MRVAVSVAKRSPGPRDDWLAMLLYQCGHRHAGRKLPGDRQTSSWLTTTDHKRIAILYAVSITFLFFIGGVPDADRNWRGRASIEHFRRATNSLW